MQTTPAPINTPSITLGALLKLANIAATGGEAKWLISEGRVKVNGQIEVRRGRKLYAGDRVEVAGVERPLEIVEA